MFASIKALITRKRDIFKLFGKDKIISIMHIFKMNKFFLSINFIQMMNVRII